MKARGNCTLGLSGVPGWRIAPRRTVDHILPKARGGTDAYANLQCLCYDCNQRKADRCEAYRGSPRGIDQFDRILAPIDQANAPT